MKNSILNFKRIIFLIPFFVLSPIPVQASPACSSVDYRSRMPPIRNQRSIEWCYAFTTADLLSFETGREVSAIGMAIMYQRNTRDHVDRTMRELYPRGGVAGFVDRFLTRNPDLGNGVYDFNVGGSSPVTLHAGANRRWVCAEEGLPMRSFRDYLNFNFMGISTRSMELPIVALRRHIMESAQGQRALLSPGMERCDMTDVLARMVMPSVNTRDFRELAQLTGEGEDPLPHLFDQACLNNRIEVPRDLQMSFTMKEGDGSNILAAIDEQLQRGPIGIDYDVNFLRNRNSTFEGMNHASSIVGRRLNPATGECEYLLRNSWGPSCSGYDPTYHCEDGVISIPASVIQQMVGGGSDKTPRGRVYGLRR